MINQEVLEDLASDCPCSGDSWCFFKEVFSRLGMSERNAEQIRLIYDYKYMESKKEDKDIGTERAFKEFIEKYAAKFAEIYAEGKKHDELFEELFGIKRSFNNEY